MLRVTLAVLLALTFAAAAPAQTGAPKVSEPGKYSGYSAEVYDAYVRSSIFVPARDGTRLAIDIFRPTKAGVVETKPLPVLLSITQYRRATLRADGTVQATNAMLPLTKYGYVVVIADARGKGASFGTRKGPWSDQESRDAYDLIGWLGKQSWSTGKVGMFGASYLAGIQLAAARAKPPGLKAIVPEIVPFATFDSFMGIIPETGPYPDEFNEANDKGTAPVDEDKDGSLLKAAIEQHRGLVNVGSLPNRDSVSKTLGIPYYQAVDPAYHLADLKQSGVAIYTIGRLGNWLVTGSTSGYANYPTPKKMLLIGGPAGGGGRGPGGPGGPGGAPGGPGAPGGGGGPGAGGGRGPGGPGAAGGAGGPGGPGGAPGGAAGAAAAGSIDTTIEHLRFFDYWLKGIDNGVMREAPVTYKVANTTEIRTSKTWPAAGKTEALYLAAGSLSKTAPASGSADLKVQYQITSGERAAKGIKFESEAFTTARLLSGYVQADFMAKTTGTDGDFLAYLQDVAPDGSARDIADGRLRASQRAEHKAPYNNLGLPFHRANAADLKPMVPGKAERLRFSFLPIVWRIEPGHKLRLIVTGAIPQQSQGMDLYNSTPKQDPAPTQTIVLGPSKLLLPFEN